MVYDPQRGCVRGIDGTRDVLFSNHEIPMPPGVKPPKKETPMIITGIGSRQTPDDICQLFTSLGAEARDRGWWIRSGHAEGADYAFEKGAGCRCIVYMPWKGFNEKYPLLGISRYNDLRDEVLDYVYRHDPYANDDMSQGVKRIKSRNVYQVLGEDLKTPSDVVICWTPDGKVVGGTGLAIRIAREEGIPIVNVGDPEVMQDFDSIIREIIYDH